MQPGTTYQQIINVTAQQKLSYATAQQQIIFVILATQQ